VRELDLAQAKPIQEIDGAHAQDENVIKVTRMQMDLIAFALAADLTRVAVLQVGGGADRTKVPVADNPRGASFHMISHRVYSDGGSGEKIPNARELHAKIDRLHAQNFKHLLDRLASYRTLEGSLLDAGFYVWTNELATGPDHGVNGVPYVGAGSARGFFKTGVVVDAGGAYNNKVLNTYINAAGIRKDNGALVDDFGDTELPRGVLSQIIGAA
jgi:hypothetical protein